jgi:drug/metabolite transporter (DMT)-like permease
MPSPYVLIFVSVLLGAVGQIFLKNGMSHVGGSFEMTAFMDPAQVLKLISNKFIILGFLNYGVASLFWLAILSKIDVSKAYPFLSFGYVITALLASYYLKESIPTYRWVGISLMIAGGYFLFKS